MPGRSTERLEEALGPQPLAGPLWDSMPAALLLCDDAGRIHDLNAAAARLLGTAAADGLRGSAVHTLWAEDHGAAWRQAHERVLRGLEPAARLTLPLAAAVGPGWVRVHMTRQPLPASGQGYLWLALEDTSAEQARAQEAALRRDDDERSRRIALSLMADAERERRRAEAASKAKSTFLAMMSHEIRTPMNGVVGAVDLLGEAGLAAQQQRLVDIARDSAHALLRIVNDVLDFSKIEAGQFDLEAIPYNWVALVDGVAELFGLAARQKRLHLICAVEPALGERWLLGDPVRLRQILVNLVGNAIKFTQTLPQRQGRIRIDVRHAAGDRSRVILRVADNGIGLSEAQRRTLFQPFVQADPSTHRRFGGTGLGLAICHRLADLMGGKVDCDGEVGQGAVFGVQLPVADAAGHGGGRSPWPDLDGARLRLALPDPALAEPLAEALAYAGAHVVQGAGAVDAAGTADLDILACGCEPDGHSQAPQLRLDFDRVQGTPDNGELTAVPLRPWAVCRAAARALGRAQGHAVESGDHDAAPGVAPPAADAAPARTARLMGLDEAADAGRLVLVAEDNAVNREVLVRQLAWLGYTALAVEDGAQALDQLTQRRVALLLTDCQMPLIDGFELTRSVRRRESERGARRLPVIGITAAAARGELDRCLTAGMDDALTKPVALQRLAQALGRWLPLAQGDGPTAQAAPPAPGTPAATAPRRTPKPRGPVLDLGALERNLGPDPQIRTRVLEAFARATPDDARAAVEAARRRDAALAGKLAHKMVSSALSVGATALAQRCRELEHLIRSGDLAGLGDATKALDDAAREAVGEVHALLRSG